jgi:hypothetical protein
MDNNTRGITFDLSSEIARCIEEEAANPSANKKEASHLQRAFALATAGSIPDSIDEFDEAEDNGEVTGSACHKYALVMFEHRSFSHAYCYAKEALKSMPRYLLHPALATVLRDFVPPVDSQGRFNPKLAGQFDELHREFMRSKQSRTVCSKVAAD